MMVFWTDPFGKRWSSDRFLREFGLSIGESARVILEAESQRPSNVLLQAYVDLMTEVTSSRSHSMVESFSMMKTQHFTRRLQSTPIGLTSK